MKGKSNRVGGWVKYSRGYGVMSGGFSVFMSDSDAEELGDL